MIKGRRLLGPHSVVICLIVIYTVIQVIFLIFYVVPNPSTNIITTEHGLPLLMPGTPPGPVAKEILSCNLEQEIQNGLEYARSFTDTKRKLLFVHIPKTAGTTVEDVGGKQAKPKQVWGSCLFNHKPKRPGNVCRYPPGQFEWPTKIGYWHLPPHLFPIKGIHPYDDADLFAVVRDPYDRLLSEFYYICRRKINTKWYDPVDCDRNRTAEPEYMNRWLRTKLQQQQGVQQTQFTSKQYLNFNGHFTSQYDFVVAPGGIRTVDYVLQMDSIVPEFNLLMDTYGINATMPIQKRNALRNGTGDELTVQHFDKKTLSLIKERYGHDILITKQATTSD